MMQSDVRQRSCNLELFAAPVLIANVPLDILIFCVHTEDIGVFNAASLMDAGFTGARG